jgi:predicted dehydrogenase
MAKVRMGIIGIGGRGVGFARMFLNELSSKAQLVAIADPNRERAEASFGYIGAQADIHTDMNEMLARKDIDAVVVTTPDFHHEEACVAAFRAKKHVLVDKPLAITGNGCLRAIEAARKSDRLLYMGFNMRHDVVLQRLKKMILDGVFGEIFSMQAIEHYNGGRTYMARWNRLKKFSGGLWIHKGSHDFDVLNWLIGDPRPVRVSCFANVFTLNDKHFPFTLRKGVKPGPTCSKCPYQKECPDAYPISAAPDNADARVRSYSRMFGEDAAKIDGYHKDLCIFQSDKDTHDQGIAIVEYDNGATASHSEYFVTPLSNRHYLIEATQGHVEADLHDNWIEFRPRWSQDKTTHKIHRDAGGHGGADPKMAAEFLDCVRHGRRPTASGIDGAWSVAIGQACELSRAQRRTIEIKEVLDTKSALLKK